jgi:MYXO-CTERM domain-containing protein
MNKLAIGSGAIGLVFALLAPLAHAQQQNPAPAPPQDVIIAGASGAAGVGVMAGFGGMGGVGGPTFQDLRMVNGGAGIPIGGGVLIQSGSGSQPIVVVADLAAPSTTLGGTLLQIDFSSYWVWTPTQPLTAGTSYQVQLSAPDLGITGITDTFAAVPAITITQPSITSEPSVSSVAETNTVACCRVLSSGFLQDSSCFPNEQRRSAILDPGFATASPAVLLNQFVFRMGAGVGSAAASPIYAWSSLVPLWFSTQAEEYCFELEAVDIVSRDVYAFDDLTSCAEHGSLGDLGVISVEPGPAELDHVVCQAPPVQYTQQWCDLNEDPCADNAMATACGLYGHICRNEPLPPDPFSMTGFAGFDGGFGAIGGAGGPAGTGGIGGSGGSSGTVGEMGGASGMGDDDDDDMPSSASHSGGCGVSTTSQRGAPSMLAFSMAVAALALIKRRRR